MPIPNKDKIVRRMVENAAKPATVVLPGTPLWDSAIDGLKKHGVEYGGAAVKAGVLADLQAGKLTLWRVGPDDFHITEKGFSPGNQSLS